MIIIRTILAVCAGIGMVLCFGALAVMGWITGDFNKAKS